MALSAGNRSVCAPNTTPTTEKFLTKTILAGAEGMRPLEPETEEEESAEGISPLGAALIQALREAGEDPSELMPEEQNEEQ